MREVKVPRNCISSRVEICPQCSNTKTVSTPAQTIHLTIDPPYRTECNKCDIWWTTYRHAHESRL
jgi:hypothetical protein